MSKFMIHDMEYKYVGEFWLQDIAALKYPASFLLLAEIRI